MANKTQVLTGYDPFVVCFFDDGITRSFPTDKWHWDFGDNCHYGYLEGIDPVSNKDNFKLPGDKNVVEKITGQDLINYKNALINMNGSRAFMRPLESGNEQLNVGYNPPTEKSKYKWGYGNENNWGNHYTGLWISTVSGNETINDGTYSQSSDTREVGTSAIPLKREGNKFITTDADSCMRYPCESIDPFNSGVFHMYKGAGVYLVTTECWRGDLVGRTLVGNVLPNNKAVEKLTNIIVAVKPTCPCVTPPKPITPDGGTGSYYYTITSDEFVAGKSNLCDYVVKVNFTEGQPITGYAPFLWIGASGNFCPRSFPVTGCWIDWTDWYQDYETLTIGTTARNPANGKTYGKVISGWYDSWATNDGVDTYTGVRSVTGNHVYTMPGCYYFGAIPEYDVSRIPSAVGEFFDIYDCEDEFYTSTPQVILKEIPLRGDDVINVDVERGTNQIVVKNVSVSGHITPGSFPIGRIDWNFGDSDKIYSFSRYDFESNNFNVNNVGDDTTTCEIIPEHIADRDFTYRVGIEDDSSYSEISPEFIRLSHIYSKENITDGYSFTISCTAYALNTRSKYTTSYTVSGFGVYPDFETEEGDVKVIDTKSYGHGDDTIVVLNGSKTDEFYTVKL